MNTDRALFASAVAIAALTAIVHVVSAQPSMAWMWGAHFYAFFPSPFLYLATAALAAALLFVGWNGKRAGETMEAALASVSAGRRHLVVAAAATAGFGAMCWLWRISHSYLGDGNVLIDGLAGEAVMHPRQPLTSLVQHGVHRAFYGWFDTGGRRFEEISQDAIAVGSVAGGLVFAACAWLLASEIARLRHGDEHRSRRATEILVWLVLLAQGYVQLFFGYVENYTFFAAVLTLFVWLMLRCARGAAPWIAPAVAFVLALALHLSAVVLAPALVALAVVVARDRTRRKALLRDVVIAAVLVAALSFALGRLGHGYRLFSVLAEVTGLAMTRRHEGIEGYMFSSMHYRDFLNEQLLIGPAGMWLFLVAAVCVFVGTAWRRVPATFPLLAAGGAYLAACWVAGDSNLGYARNWDLLAPAGIAMTAAGLGLLAARPGGGVRLSNALALLVLASLYHTVPWIATNADLDRSITRLRALPLGHGRTEVVLSNVYRRQGDVENQVASLEEAVAKYPYNNNAHYLLGMHYYRTKQFDRAAESFAAAARLRPDKVMFRHRLVESLYFVNRLPDAIPHLEFLIEKEPDQIRNWVFYAEALQQSGQRERALPVFRRIEEMYQPILAADPDGHDSNLGYGWVLYNLERYQEALRYLARAIEANPSSLDAYCFMGHSLRALGRDHEAAENYQRCLESNPGFLGREEITTWLNEIN